MKLDYQGALKRIPEARGVWLMQGDEPLLHDNLLNRFRKHWQAADIERQRIDLSRADDWIEAVNHSDTLSLFSSRMAIEVHGNLKADAKGIQALTRFLQLSPDNLLLAVFPKQDSADLKSKFFQWIEANGTLVTLKTGSQREQALLLQEQAQELGLRLDDAAWHRVHDHALNNLLAGQQILLRLHYLTDQNTVLTEAQVQDALIDQSRFSVFDLIDSVLQGDAAKALRILHFLQETAESPAAVLALLNRDLKAVMQLQAGQSPQALGIWQSRQGLFQKAARRVSAADSACWPALCLAIDCAIKGLTTDNPWLLLQQLALRACGVVLFPAPAES